LEAELGVSFKHKEGNRFEHRDRLEPMVELAIRALPHNDVVARFEATGVCYGLYRSLADAVAEDPMFAASNPIFTDVGHPSGLTYRTPGFPASYGRTERQPSSSAPRLGQHTEEVLSTVLRLPSQAIATLHDRGIIQISD
jgi:2-methylfumaryl-CoA isomerase